MVRRLDLCGILYTLVAYVVRFPRAARFGDDELESKGCFCGPGIRSFGTNWIGLALWTESGHGPGPDDMCLDLLDRSEMLNDKSGLL